MNKTPIKLVVTDMDGTLLNSNHELPSDFFEVYESLKKEGILFVAASGRQYESLVHYFDSIQNEMAFLAENGSYVVYKGEELFIDSIPLEMVHQVIDQVRQIPEAQIVLCTKNKAFIESKDESFIKEFSHFYYNSAQVNDLKEIVGHSVIKLAIHHAKSSEEYIYPYIGTDSLNGIKVVVSGQNWLDVMNSDTNKGKALKKLQEQLAIKDEETIVFGDYMNDLEMLSNSINSYAMANAHPEVKKIARYETVSNNDGGVIKVLKNLTH